MTPQEKLAALAEKWRKNARELGRNGDPNGAWNDTLNCCADELTTLLSEQGEVVVTTDASGRCVAVTRQDDEGRILSTIWEASEHGGGGWYCANCKREVAPTEVTYSETHEACGRKISDDAPPTPSAPVGVEAVLRRIVAEADTHPFNPIGHVIEHVVPEARNLHPPTPSAPKVRRPLLSEGGAGCHDCDGYQDEGVFCPTCGTDHGEDSSPPSAPVVQPDWGVAPPGATHYQPRQDAYYKRVSASEWYVWSRMGTNELLRWLPSHGTSDNAEWVVRPAEMQLPPSAPVVDDARYDAGLLNDYGGGNVEWWHDYIRAELDRAHDFYIAALSGVIAPVGVEDHVRRQVGRLAQWSKCMSHNESYFGEPAGLVKSVTDELSHAVDPIYPPIVPPADPLAGVTIHTATLPLTPPAAEHIHDWRGDGLCDSCGATLEQPAAAPRVDHDWQAVSGSSAKKCARCGVLSDRLDGVFPKPCATPAASDEGEQA